MMKKVTRRLLIITSCAYLFVTLSFTILPIGLVPEVMTESLLHQTFWICFATAIAAEVSTRYPYKHGWTSVLCPYLFVSFSVFFLGSIVFKIIPLEPLIFCSVSLTIIVIYIVVYFTVYGINKNDANEINKQLQKKQNGRESE